MAYTPTAWVDNSSPDINATNLNHMETGIDQAHDLAENHIADTVDAHDASAISFSPTGTVAATDVQAAIAEVASESGGGGSSAPFSDATALVKDNTDATKLVRVEAGTVATGTTRVLTMPNADVNLGALTNSNIDAAAAIAETKLNLASDAAAGTASRRTLGTSSTSAAAGNDARFTRYLIRDWSFSGTLTANVTGAFKVPIHETGTINSIRITLGTASSSGAVTADVNKNGTTLYTTQGNRPSLSAGTTSTLASSPDVTSLSIGDYLSVDIDAFGTGAANLIISVRYTY